MGFVVALSSLGLRGNWGNPGKGTVPSILDKPVGELPLVGS